MTDYEILTNYPDVLTAKHLQEILHISRAGAYNLMNRHDFPTLHVCGRKLVAKDKLLGWMESNTQGME
jgi:predicted DNA-binding transcriptional regulator AlpA